MIPSLLIIEDETLLGSEQGPRMGSFIALYGIAPTRQLIAEALAKA